MLFLVCVFAPLFLIIKQGVAADETAKAPLAPKPGKSMLNARVVGSGSAVPKQVVTNDDIAAMGLDTSDEWISSRTGIQQRCSNKEKLH
jgi:hypothetical protein